MTLVVCWWFHFDGAKWILCIGLFPFILGIGWHHSTERLLLEFIILCDGSFDLVVHRCDERLDLGERFEFLFLFVILSYFILSSSLFFFLNYVLFAWRFQFRYILRSRSFFAAYLTFISPSLSLSLRLFHCKCNFQINAFGMVYVPFCFYCRRNLWSLLSFSKKETLFLLYIDDTIEFRCWLDSESKMISEYWWRRPSI